MSKIIYFDYCAVILLVVLLITTISRGMTRGKTNRYFLIMLLVALIAAIADVCALNLDRLGDGYETSKYISHSIYLLTHCASTLCYNAYLFALTDTWHLLHKNRVMNICLLIPILGVVLLLAINPLTDFIFYLDAEGDYTRGRGFLVLYIVTVIYVIYGCSYLCKYRKLFTKEKFISLLSIYPLLATVTVIQFFFPNHLLELFANAVGLTYISMMIQRPEDLINSITGLLRLSAYVTNMDNANITKKPMEIIMINIVNYTVVFDMLGYDRLNYLLRSIANQLIALNKNQRADSELYYLGNGKFRMVLNKEHFNQTQDIAHMINRALKPGIQIHQMEISLVTHVCIARYPEDISDADSLLAFGNDLNKRPYTGEVMFASDLFKKEHYDIMRDIDNIMEQALTEHKFEVYYQPIYSVDEHRFHSAEALLRLKTEKYGFISPEIFIPAAEKSGAIHKIGAFVIEEVCKFISSEEYKSLGIQYIEVNLSVAQCMQSNLAKDILCTLDMYEVTPDQINLEITETAASYSQNVMMANLEELSDAGFSFSLDDYGTGYSNIRRIASLPLQIIKLDKTFTNTRDNPKMMVILENTIHMIKDMNLKIVVEGIETEETMKQFAELECEYIQGFYYSRPIPRDEFVSFIRAAKEDDGKKYIAAD